MFLHVRGCNFLNHPSLHYEVGVQTCNYTRSADSGEIIYFCISIQFGNILIPLYFAGSNNCLKSYCTNFSLQSKVTECLILFCGTPPPKKKMGGGGGQIFKGIFP